MGRGSRLISAAIFENCNSFQIPKYCEYFFWIASVAETVTAIRVIDWVVITPPWRSPLSRLVGVEHNKFRQAARGRQARAQNRNPDFALARPGLFPDHDLLA
jgi:hypothetical protein